jgi:hypothetical protein
MARRPGLPATQLRALDRLKSVRGIDRFYLAVTLGLTWFEDAEAETVRPKGMTDKLWKAIRRYFEEQAPPLVLSLERQRK